MQPTKLFNDIRLAFNQYSFAAEGDFRWSPDTNTVFYRPPKQIADIWSLLHELAHAELKHTSFTLDIELVTCESQAWEYARTVLAPQFNLAIDEDYIEDHLDTYRHWMFARSRCPNCGQNGLQTQNTYSCINCRCLWRANEARLCNLRRIKQQIQSQTVF